MASCLLALPRGIVSAKFETWQATHKKSYHSIEEKNAALLVFHANDARITNHNLQGLPYVLGHNMFSDLSSDAFADLYLSTDQPKSKIASTDSGSISEPHRTLGRVPDFDWSPSHLNKVTAVKDQGTCGSCWAFSAIAAVESAYAVGGGILTSFNENQLLQCVNGANCNGGVINFAFDYIVENGITDSFPAYNGRITTCSTSIPRWTMLDYVQVGLTDASMINAVNTMPTSVTMGFTSQGWGVLQSYLSGVISADTRGSDGYHSMLAVGYGTDDIGGPYFKLKNQFGSSNWGESGYVRISRINFSKNNWAFHMTSVKSILAQPLPSQDLNDNSTIAAIGDSFGLGK